MPPSCSPAGSQVAENKRRVGRSAPRSRTGCTTCKRRKVRCDESTPVCANCTRLGAECTYQTHPRHRLRQSDRNSRERPPSNAPVSPLGPAIDYLDGPLVGHDIDSHSSSENNTLFFDFSAFSRNALDLWCSSSTALPEPPYGDVFPLEDPEGLDLNVCEGVLPSALSPQNIHQTTIAPQLPNPEQDSRRNGNQAEEGIDPVASKENHLLREVVPNFRRIATGMFYAPDVSNNGSDESIRRRGEALGVYFQESVFVPSVTNIDIPSWRSLCRRILNMARSSSIVSNAVVALAQLHFVKFPPSAERGKEPQVLRNGYNLAQYLYIFAKETLGNGLDFLQKEPSESLRLELLVALFLLSCFELIDKEDIHRAHQLKWADNLLEGIEQSDFMVQQIIHLMLLCDARVVTLGGNGILPRRPPPLPSGPYTPVSPATNYNKATESSPQDTGEVQRQNEIHPRSPPPDRLAKRPRQLERSGQEYSSFSLSTLKESILRDAVYFHHRSEQFLRRVAMLDRHRRPRGTPEDEVEVTTSARSIINDLHRLWDERPAILDSDRQELSQVLHPELARDVARLLCVFRACFWSNFCYLYRAAWWDRRTKDEEFAVEQTWKALRGSVDQKVELQKTRDLDGAGEPLLNSAAMWALWVFSTECSDSDKVNWCIGKLEELGHAVDYGPGGEHATIHAAKAALLLREVVERQWALNRRLDVRFVALELFGFMFPIL